MTVTQAPRAKAYFIILVLTVLTTITLNYHSLNHNRYSSQKSIFSSLVSRVNGRHSKTECDHRTLPPTVNTTVTPISEFETLEDITIPDGLKSYIQRHQQLRECFLNNTCKERPKALIWKCLTDSCGGLGDRMRGIRLIFLISIALDWAFFLEWPKSNMATIGQKAFPLTSVLHPNLVDWRLPHIMLHNRSSWFRRERVTKIIFNQHKKNVLYNPLPKRRKNHKSLNIQGDENDLVPLISADFHELFYPFDIIYISNRIQRSAFSQILKNPHHHYHLHTVFGSDYVPLKTKYVNNQTLLSHIKSSQDISDIEQSALPTSYSSSSHAIDRLLMKTLFKPSSKVKAAIDARTFSKSTPHIAIHARTGFDTKEDTSLRLNRVQKYGIKKTSQLILNCIKQYNNDSTTNIFLASDSNAFKAEFAKIAEQPHFNYNVKTTESLVLHFDLTASRRLFRQREQRCDAFVDIFADMFALGESSSFFYLHSGFASTAIDFGSVPHWREIDIKSSISNDELGQCNIVEPGKRTTKRLEDDVDDDDDDDDEEEDPSDEI